MKKSHKNRFVSLTLSFGNMKNTENRGILRLKILLVLLLLMSAAFSTPDLSIAAYAVIQLTNNTSNTSYNHDPQINARGWVTWERDDDPDCKIFLYNGISVTNIANISDFYGYAFPEINDSGWITWQGYDGNDHEIYLYNGTTVTNISNNNSYEDASPEINARGWVTWEGDDDSDDYEAIYLYNGTSVTKISKGINPKINDSGWITWQRYNHQEIYLYNGTTVTTIAIAFTSYDNSGLGINASGWVTWSGMPMLGDFREIYLYNGATVTNISNNTNLDASPQINARGWVTWRGDDDNGYDAIYLYNGTSVTKISNNTGDNYDPEINGRGWVTWSGYDGNDYEIYLYNGTTVTNISNNPNHSDSQPQINDNGWVTWEGGNEIFLAKPSNVAPSRPSNLTAKAKTSTQITLGWKDNSNSETGFKIERKTGDCGSTNDWTQIATKSINATTHTISGLKPNTTYAFRVRAYNESGNSVYPTVQQQRQAHPARPQRHLILKQHRYHPHKSI